MVNAEAAPYVTSRGHTARWLASLVTVFALGSVSGASAATYYIIQSNPASWTVMDPKGVEDIPGEGRLRKAWTVRVQRNILTGDPPQPGYVRTLSEFDCDKGLARWREFSAFSRSGASLISNQNSDPAWGQATESYETYAAFKLACRNDGGRVAVSADSVAKVVISLMASWDPPAPPPAKPIKSVAAKAKVAAPPAKAVVAKPAAAKTPSVAKARTP